MLDAPDSPTPPPPPPLLLFLLFLPLPLLLLLPIIIIIVITLAWDKWPIWNSYPRANILRAFGYLEEFVNYGMLGNFIVEKEMEAQRKVIDSEVQASFLDGLFPGPWGICTWLVLQSEKSQPEKLGTCCWWGHILDRKPKKGDRGHGDGGIVSELWVSAPES